MIIQTIIFKESGKFDRIEEMTSNREVFDTDGIIESINENYDICTDFVFKAKSDDGTQYNCRLVKYTK